jgi:uncharacterized protein (TIGR02145 family)
MEDISGGLQIGAYTLPATDGTADQALVTDGSGAVTWGAPLATDDVGNNYGTVVNNTTGKTWLDRNLGATQVATSSTDAAAYGDLYQWGRAADGHEDRGSSNHAGPVSTWIADEGTNAWDGLFVTSLSDWLSTAKDDLWSGTAAENNPCPSGFRIPTNAEWNQERRSWASQNAAGAFGSPLKLTVGGFRDRQSGSPSCVDTFGYYWSSTVDGSYARSLYFNISNAPMRSDYRAGGFSIRCIKD